MSLIEQRDGEILHPDYAAFLVKVNKWIETLDQLDPKELNAVSAAISHLRRERET